MITSLKLNLLNENGTIILETDDEARELLRLLGMPFKGMNKQA